jgi:hypothetical protein
MVAAADYKLLQAPADIAAVRGQLKQLQYGFGPASFPGTSVGAASLTDLATAEYPAGDAYVGAVYELEVNGNFTQATGSATTLKLGVSFGGVADSNQVLGSGFAPVGGTGRFVARVWAVCVTTGAGGTWKTMMWATVTQNATPNNSVTVVDCSPAGTISADTTAEQTLSLQAAWGTTAGSPSIISRVAVFRRII